MEQDPARSAAEQPTASCAITAAAAAKALQGGAAAALLIEGDAEEWLQTVRPGSGGLCYVDPPFATGKERRGAEGSYSDAERDPQLYARRLEPMLRLLWQALGEHGTLIVHLDWHCSHYVKVLLDEICGYERFRNEIVWCYNGGSVPRQDFPRKHDTLLRYTRGGAPRFHVQRRPFKENTQSVGRHSTYASEVAIDLERGTPLTDWWTDIPTVTGWNPERTGYPTQKPLMLLRRLIEICTDPEDLVLDPCCGSGTTALAAAQLGRRFACGDRSPDAVRITGERLRADGRTFHWAGWAPQTPGLFF